MSKHTEMKASEQIPSNVAVKETLESTRQALKEQEMRNPNLDTKGRAMAREAEELMGTAQRILKERNSDELLQQFIRHSMDLSERARVEAEKHHGDMRDAWYQVQQFAPKVRSVIYDLIITPEFQMDLLETSHVFAGIVNKIQKSQVEGTQKIEHISEDEKKRMVDKIVDLHVRCGKNPKFRAYRRDFYQLWGYLLQRNETMDPSLRNEIKHLFDEGIDVFQRICGGKQNLHQLTDRFRDFSTRVQNDPETRKFWYEWKQWSESIVDHPGNVNEKTKQEGYRLLNQSLNVFKGKYADDLDWILTQWSQFLETIQKNELNQEFVQHLKGLRQTFRGSTLQTLTQARHLVGPILQNVFSEIPLPDVHGETDTSNYSFTNMKLKGKELNVDDFVLKLRIGMKDALQLKLWIRNINITLENVHFVYNRTSMPTFSDSGVCSVNITAPKWYLKWVVSDKEPHFQVEDINCKLKTFAFNIEEAKHPWIDNILLSFFSGVIRSRVEEKIREQLTQQGNILGQKFNEFFSQDWSNPQQVLDPFSMQYQQTRPSYSTPSSSSTAETKRPY